MSVSDFEKYRLRAERLKHLEMLYIAVQNMIGAMQRGCKSSELLSTIAEVKGHLEKIEKLPAPNSSTLQN